MVHIYNSPTGEYMRMLTGMPDAAWFIVDKEGKIVSGLITFPDSKITFGAAGEEA